MRATRLLGVIGGVCAIAVAAPASGAGKDSILLCANWGGARHPDTASMAVSYRDLDLRLLEGRRALKNRIEAAANQLCWKVVDTRFLADQMACRGEAIYAVRDQVRLAELQASAAGPPAAAPSAGR